MVGLVKNVTEYAVNVGETVKSSVQDAVGGRGRGTIGMEEE